MNIGNIRTPLLIGPFSLEITLQQMRIVKRSPLAWLGPIGIPSPGHRTDTELSHQPQDCFVVDLEPIFPLDPELDAPVAIGAAAGPVSFLNQFQAKEIRIRLSGSFPPGIVGGSRDAEEFTHSFHFVSSPVVFDDPISRFASEP